MVETDVHYPTDTNLLWDAMRVAVRATAEASYAYGLGGWRQSGHQLKTLKSLYHGTRKYRPSNSKDPERQQQQRERIHQTYRAYLAKAQSLIDKMVQTIRSLSALGALEEVEFIQTFITHARRQIDQIKRRVLRGETIAHNEKVFSLFEPHTRWLCKGKAGVPVELGVAVCVLEDQHQFILHHDILWQQTDNQVAVSMVKQTQAQFPSLTQCSFDRGFHSQDNQQALAECLDRVILPKKGRLSQQDKAREHHRDFIKARHGHSAVESCINNLEHRGLDRCRAHGQQGFERSVALSILAYNLHRLGLILQRKEKARLARQTRRRLAA